MRSNLRTWAILLSILFAPLFLRAQQDIQVIGGTNPYIVIGRGLVWNGSGPGNINNNFIFSPIDPNQGFCLFVSNNNFTSAHTFSVVVSQTGDPTLKFFQGFSQKWFPVATTTTFPVNVTAGGIVGINYKTTASAGITVQISGATTASGSPDTADVFAVQTSQSSCGALPVNSVQGPFQSGNGITTTQQFPVLIGGVRQPNSSSTLSGFAVGSQGNGFPLDANANTSNFFNGSVTPMTNYASPFGVDQLGNHNLLMQTVSVSGFGHNGVSFGFTKNNFLEVASDQLNYASTESSIPGWEVTGAAVNPASGAAILADFDANTSSVAVAYKAVVVSCSAACTVQVNAISSAGVTCTTLTAQNLNVYGGTRKAYGTGHTATNNCTTQPTTVGAILYQLFLGAGVAYTIDLSGFVVSVGGNGGIGVFSGAALTGNMSASLTLVEQ